jgi:hypothetical protein
MKWKDIFAFVIGLGPFVLIVVKLGQNVLFARKMIKKGIPTMGTIIEHFLTKSGLSTYHIIVRFLTKDGIEITGKPKNFINRDTNILGKNSIGKQIGIRYDPENPENFIDDRVSEKYLFPLTAITILSILIVVIAYCLIKDIRK